MAARKWTTEQISRRTLYLLITVVAVVYGLFALVGFNVPSEEYPEFNEPLFTDALLAAMWVFTALALVLGVASIVRSYRQSPRAEDSNGIPYRRISRVIWVAVALCMGITFATGSTLPMTINGEDYTDELWLRVADMFVWSSLVLLAIAGGAMIFGATRYVRKGRRP